MLHEGLSALAIKGLGMAILGGTAQLLPAGTQAR